METVRGYIDHFIYEKDAFKILVLQCGSTELICKGSMPGIAEGENVEFSGQFVMDPKYGRQFQVESAKSVKPSGREAIIRYLGSGAIAGVGPKKATQIVDFFGEDALEIIEREPERLAELKGISLRQARIIGQEILEKKNSQRSMILLQQYKIGPQLSAKIIEKFASSVEEILRFNPYKLVEEIEGIGFRRADEIAKLSEVPMDSELRIRSGIIYTLREVSVEGHCCYPRESLLRKVSLLLELPEEYIDNYLMKMSMEDRPPVKILMDLCFLPVFYYEEVYCAKKLVELKETYDPVQELMVSGFFEKHLAEIEESENIELDTLQKQAVEAALRSGVFVLSGGPGTGKTTTIATILHFFENLGFRFVLAAPTGRAAKRMTEATGYEASTIHRLLELQGGEDGGYGFSRNEDNPLECDAVIVDEASMVDIHLLYALLKAMQPGTKLVLIGDRDQLSSVGPGQVLSDVLGSGAFENCILEKIYRQGGDSQHIVENAHKINRGELLDYQEKYEDFFLLSPGGPENIYGYIVELMRRVIPKRFGVGVLDTCVLAPKRKGPLGVDTLNEILQKYLNPPEEKKRELVYGEKTFRVGDRVMQIKNNYNIPWEVYGKKRIPIDHGEGIFNGDLGVIMEINTFLKTTTVQFDDERVAEYNFEGLSELELAYALTIHKSQGGQYPAVIMPLLEKAGNLGADRAAFLNRNLFYTGVTRAKNCVVLLGDPDAFNSMILAGEGSHRYTNLKQRIMEMDAL